MHLYVNTAVCFAPAYFHYVRYQQEGLAMASIAQDVVV